MARVDPYDDTIERWVAFHYRYDPERRERRNVIVAAFDRQRDFSRFLKASGAGLRAAIARGDAEPVEGMSGVRWPVGYHARVAATRLYAKPPKRRWPSL